MWIALANGIEDVGYFTHALMLPVRRIGLVELQSGREILYQGLIPQESNGLLLNANRFGEVPGFRMSGSEGVQVHSVFAAGRGYDLFCVPHGAAPISEFCIRGCSQKPGEVV